MGILFINWRPVWEDRIFDFRYWLRKGLMMLGSDGSEWKGWS